MKRRGLLVIRCHSVAVDLSLLTALQYVAHFSENWLIVTQQDNIIDLAIES